MSRNAGTIVRAIALLSVVAIGCRDSSGPLAQTLDGSFTLSRVNGRTLPDTQAVAPSQAPGGEACAVLATGGTLSLDAASGKFTLTVNGEHSCRPGEFLLLTEAGTYSQHGSNLTMAEPFPDHVANLTGQIDQASITIHGVFYDYTFARQ